MVGHAAVVGNRQSKNSTDLHTWWTNFFWKQIAHNCTEEKTNAAWSMIEITNQKQIRKFSLKTFPKH